MKKFINNNLIFLLPILSGILLILAYPPYDLEFLIWFALIPLLWFIFSKRINLRKALLGGTICGIIFFGKLFSWLFATYPFEWLGIGMQKNNVFVFILLIILYVIQTVFLGLFFGVFAWIAKCLIRRIKHLAIRRIEHLLIIPCLWIVLEYLRAWGFGILYLGKESFLGPHWTFGNLAYTLHNNLVLIQIADIVGIYGISFLIVFVSTSLFYLGVKLPNKRMVLIIIFLILIGSIWYGYGIYQLRSSDVGDRNSHIIKIALLQTNFLSGSEFNAYQKTEVFKAVLDLFKSPKAISEKAELVIAPEGFGIVSLTKNKEIAKYLLKDFWQPGQVFLENQKVIANTTSKSRLFYYDLEKESPIAFHDKMLLVPNGDYLPYLTKAILNICSFGIGTEYEQRLHQRGEKINVAHLPAGKAGSSKGNIGGTICSSIVSPEINRKMTKNGAEFLVVVSSDAPFHGSKTLLAQNLAMSKLRAIENRRYFAQATNMGYSFLLNPKGEIIVKTSQFGNKILFSSIYLLNKKTIYTKFNDWIVILAALVLILFFIKTVIHIRRFT